MQRLRVAMVPLLIWTLTSPAAASTADFEKVKKGSQVRIVLADGGECRGQVSRRGADSLDVKLAADGKACGAPDAIVTVLQSNIISIEKAEASVARKIAARMAGFGITFGGVTAGIPIAFRNQYAGVAVILGSVAAGVAVDQLLVRKGSGYRLFVSRLGVDASQPTAHDPD